MSFQALVKILSFSLALSLSHGIVAHANEAEKKEPKKEEKKEEKGGEKKEGEAKEGGESEVNESQKKQANEAAELQTRVQALQAKIKTKEENITKLIEEKNHSKDAEEIKNIIKEMVTEHKEMGKMIEEYEQNRSLLRYRYPEKGYKGVRTYERMEVKPLEQMENQMSIESKLKRNMKTVQSQFGEAAKTPKKKRAGKEETVAPSLTEPIVIKK
jgi:hypothetical protein